MFHSQSHAKMSAALCHGALLALLVIMLAVPAWSQTRTYTLDADFDEGTLINVNHDSPNNDRLQLNETARPFPFVYIACSGRGSVVRIDVETGAILGEYWTSPSGMGRNPSRTTVDQFGNVWVANRAETGLSGGARKGSITRIGLVIGGTRVNADGTPNPTGQYLAPPFAYSTVADRDGDGLIKTSLGLGNILAWSNSGGADTDGGVTTADDECIINFTRVEATGTRTLAIDANNDLWVGGIYGVSPYSNHVKVDGASGNEIPGSLFNYGCGGYGGLIDGNGILWSAGRDYGLLRYDPVGGTHACFTGRGDYGLGIDPNNGHIWHSGLGYNRVYELAPDGSILNWYPQPFGAQGVVVDANSHVWVAELFGSRVLHLAPNPNVPGTHFQVGVVTGFVGTTGLAVDLNGKIWASEQSNRASRVDPALGPLIMPPGGSPGQEVPLGAIDLSVPLGSGASPYNYSDMTGAVLLGTLHGSWTVVYDGGSHGIEWSLISWTADLPDSTGLAVEARAADAIVNLPSQPWMPISSGAPLAGLVGQFVEVQVIFDRAPGVEASPILYDLTISAVEEVIVDIKPTSCPNPLNIKYVKGDVAQTDHGSTLTGIGSDKESKAPVIPVAILGTDEFDVDMVDPSTIMLEGVPVIRWAYEDVAAPVGEDAEYCECTTAGPDGYRDLTLKFDKGAVIDALGMVVDGQVVVLTLTGEMYDGRNIEGMDCMIIRGPKAAAPLEHFDLETPSVALIGASPNPFNPITTLSFTLSTATEYSLTIYNITGQIVRSIDGIGQAGLNQVTWDASQSASGVYFYRLDALGQSDKKKMVLLK
ncbi:MAG: T9SS type A sorting domain-containing protein [bacterium]